MPRIHARFDAVNSFYLSILRRLSHNCRRPLLCASSFWPHLHGSEADCWNVRGELDRLIQILRFNQDKPPICSSVSTKGPSVIKTFPLRIGTVVAEVTDSSPCAATK